MTEIYIFLSIFSAILAGFFWGRKVGYSAGFIDGKHDMADFISRNTYSYDKTTKKTTTKEIK